MNWHEEFARPVVGVPRYFQYRAAVTSPVFFRCGAERAPAVPSRTIAPAFQITSRASSGALAIAWERTLFY
jgi:hypothetical protein